jgi:hypothetical protein
LFADIRSQRGDGSTVSAVHIDAAVRRAAAFPETIKSKLQSLIE